MPLRALPNPKGPLRSARAQIVEGIFGTHTAVVDFCEDNYAITPYIAECTNALSNIAYIAFGLLGISHARSQNLPQRVQTCHASLVVLGIGSTLFHATLMKTAMMMDDLPMMWLVSTLLYSIMQPYGRKGADYPLGIFLIGINLVILICDLLEVNQLFHYSSFALLGIAAAGKFVWLVVAHPNAVSGETRRKVLDWFALGTACILFAFAIWNVENIYCDSLWPLKQQIGLPFALVLELHAYWHILTALGAYIVLTAGSCLALAVQEGHPNFGLHIDKYGLPSVVRLAEVDVQAGKKKL